MNKVLQTRQGAPHGNCHMACLASIFEVSIEDVPDHPWPEDVAWQEAQDGPQQTERGRRVRDERYEIFQAWLAERNLTSVGFPVTPGGWIPKGYALGSVTNPRGIPHYVVCFDGRIVWDPNPLQDSYDRTVEILEYFVALNPAKGAAAR